MSKGQAATVGAVDAQAPAPTCRNSCHILGPLAPSLLRRLVLVRRTKKSRSEGATIEQPLDL